jgi:hypothetical protein
MTLQIAEARDQEVLAETMHRWADADRSPGFLQRLGSLTPKKTFHIMPFWRFAFA